MRTPLDPKTPELDSSGVLGRTPKVTQRDEQGRPVRGAQPRLPVVAIAGNPNTGKTCVFNHLTGTVQSVANYPGVTVQHKEGRARANGRTLRVVDLPGTYSLTAYSLDELVARDFVIEQRPDVVVAVVDASNLERNLYMVAQLLEMRPGLVIALNMIDVADRRGFRISTEKLTTLLGAPVVETIASKGRGMRELLEACVKVIDGEPGPHRAQVHYGHEVEEEVQKLTEVIAAESAVACKYVPRWLAVKLIEKDTEVRRKLRALTADWGRIEAATDAAIHAIESHFGDSAETIIAERRYGFAAAIVRECVARSDLGRQHISDKIDQVVCNRVLGPVILAGVVYALFVAVFKVADEWGWLFGRSPTGWMDWSFVRLSGVIAGLQASAPQLHSLLNDGVIGGVGAVISFVPLIAVMFMFVAILEDTGYIARVAFIMDRAFRAFGLQGRSILAMIVAGGLGGGGCAVPAVMATRTLREEKDRLVTMLVAPMMNCGAKLPVYLMLIAAFFDRWQAQMMFTLWAISWALALCAGWVLRRFVIRGRQTPFVMELPAYHVPTLRGVLLHTWERTWMYLKKAGTIILAINLLLWAVMSYPRVDPVRFADEKQARRAQLESSIAGRAGRALTPITRLAGFDWRENVALIGGFAAKEVVVGAMGTAHSIAQVEADQAQPNAQPQAESLSARLASDPSWTALRAFALMIFVMVYAPCFVTLVVIRRESGSWRWALFSTAYSTSFAFVLAVLVFQVGTAFGWGT